MFEDKELLRLAVSSAFNETILREGSYRTLEELSSYYKTYMKLRFEMLDPNNKVLHEGSLKAYDCTLRLISDIMNSLDELDSDEKNKIIFKKILQKDYDKIKALKEEFKKKLFEFYE